MDNTGEDHPLNKLRVVIEPGLWGVPVLPQSAGGNGGKRGVVVVAGKPYYWGASWLAIKPVLVVGPE